MEKGKTAQPNIGTWTNLPTEAIDRKPKIEFELNKPKKLVFLANDPREYQGETGAYYIFDVEENKEPKVIMTSAWSLLRALKLLHPLAGKTIDIVKKMAKGKQFFEAVEDKEM